MILQTPLQNILKVDSIAFSRMYHVYLVYKFGSIDIFILHVLVYKTNSFDIQNLTS